MKTIKIHNIETGEITERDMTADELAQCEADELRAAQQLEAASEAAAEAANAKAVLLEKLGITKEEAKLLLS